MDLGTCLQLLGWYGEGEAGKGAGALGRRAADARAPENGADGGGQVAEERLETVGASGEEACAQRAPGTCVGA